ncbi:RagB/SusD family nutrient uptake outer membrane protein [Bacteroides sp.]
MKKSIIAIALLSGLFLFSSCDNWLTQEDLMGMSEDQTYSEEAGITSVVSNFYSRMKYWQDFGTDGESYDFTRWDEACNNSQYWTSAGNVNSFYREYYDYTLIREINLHIANLTTKAAGKIPEPNRKYYLAEARYLRAFVYFRLVTQMGGVPLITEATEYTDDPLSLAKPRNKESEIYDFIISEMDAVRADFGNATSKTRATEGAAMALKCRAALYAGTLAYNFDKSAAKTLNLASGATGIEKSKAPEYLRACLDACAALESLGYRLYQGNSNLAENYYEAFTVEPKSNPETILCKAYDGVNLLNYFTTRAIARSITKADRVKTGCQINPVLNLVNNYEILNSHEMTDMDAYVGEEVIEDMGTYTSNQQYRIYDHPEDIFAGRDPRLAGTILYPGATFRDATVDLQAGLAIPTGSGYEFKAARTLADLSSKYEGEKITGEDGPICNGGGNWYISHTGFLLRKFVDATAGSELNGASKVPYVVFRYGEALLNAAEAAFYLNELGIAEYNGRSTRTMALDYLNQVRQRAGGDAFKLSDSELTFERIVNERRVELAFEDHRYYDLKRWRVADEWWHYDLESKTASIYVLWPYKIYAPGTADNGKWIYRKMKAIQRADNATLSFNNTMYYNSYPMNEGNPYIEKNPNH